MRDRSPYLLMAGAAALTAVLGTWLAVVNISEIQQFAPTDGHVAGQNVFGAVLGIILALCGIIAAGIIAGVED